MVNGAAAAGELSSGGRTVRSRRDLDGTENNVQIQSQIETPIREEILHDGWM